MMMAATASKVSQRVMVKEQEWLKLFPTQMTENYTSSVTFMKQLTVVAVSMITYLKNAFPEDSYSTEMFAGLQLKILNNRNCEDDLAYFVSTALQQTFEAFDKKYVHKLALCFYEDSCEPDNLIEYHIFEYSYNAGGVVMDIKSKGRGGDARAARYSLDRVKSRTACFIRALSMFLLQQSPSELPANYDVSLRIYYNDNAPEEYQAPGFLPTVGADPLARSLHAAVRLGWVETPFHSLVARSYTRAAPSSDEAVASDNAPVMTQADKDDFQDSSDVDLQCICNQSDGGEQKLVTFTCEYCHRKQHAVCYGFLRRAPRTPCCVACATGHRRASDAQLAELDPRRRECLALFRRSLQLCSRASVVAGAALRLPPAGAARALRLLAAHDIVPADAAGDLTIERKINHAQLKVAMKRFFQDVAEADPVVEPAAARADPLGDVLSPLEKISLQNSTLGQLISPPTSTSSNPVDDDTLQQYRRAVLANQDVSEELPLSGSHNPVKDVEKIGKRKAAKRKTDDDDWLPKKRSGSRNKKDSRRS